MVFELTIKKYTKAPPQGIFRRSFHDLEEELGGIQLSSCNGGHAVQEDHYTMKSIFRCRGKNVFLGTDITSTLVTAKNRYVGAVP